MKSRAFYKTQQNAIYLNISVSRGSVARLATHFRCCRCYELLCCKFNRLSSSV